MSSSMKAVLIAPCGMNCGICLAYLREKAKCPGCRGEDAGKNASCIGCKIKNCASLRESGARYCFACAKYPCERVKHLDKRYRTRYGMSMIENLENIRRNGVRKFLETERGRWACPKCGGVVCVHREICPQCGEKIRQVPARKERLNPSGASHQ